MRRPQFTLKTVFVVVTLAGAWSLICRLAFLAIADTPDVARSPLRMATAAYLVLAPAGIALWIYGVRLKPGKDRRRRLVQLAVLTLGNLSLGSAVLTGLFVFQLMRALNAQ